MPVNSPLGATFDSYLEKRDVLERTHAAALAELGQEFGIEVESPDACRAADEAAVRVLWGSPEEIRDARRRARRLLRRKPDPACIPLSRLRWPPGKLGD